MKINRLLLTRCREYANSRFHIFTATHNDLSLTVCIQITYCNINSPMIACIEGIETNRLINPPTAIKYSNLRTATCLWPSHNFGTTIRIDITGCHIDTRSHGLIVGIKLVNVRTI